MPPIFATIDPYILAFSAVTVFATIFMGFWTARKSKTASDFFVAGRSVSVGWNASAISGEYLSAASFMGIAGMVMSSGYDALWYPVCYACGYLFLLLFIAGPLRRFGAYTIPDFAEGRFDSPVFRKIAVCFVLFIGFFYTMPQMKGAGTTLAYIFPGLPYWAGVVLVGAVITLNVALGGMKGITLVQAVQYWAKMFAISVPIFVLMAVYGHYGKQLQLNGSSQNGNESMADRLRYEMVYRGPAGLLEKLSYELRNTAKLSPVPFNDEMTPLTENVSIGPAHFPSGKAQLALVLQAIGRSQSLPVLKAAELSVAKEIVGLPDSAMEPGENYSSMVAALSNQGISLLTETGRVVRAVPSHTTNSISGTARPKLPEKAPADSTWLSPFGPLTTKAAKAAAGALAKPGTAQISTNIHPRFRLYLPPYELSTIKPPPPSAKPKGLVPFVKHFLGLDHRASLLPPGSTNITIDLALQFVASVKNWEIIRIENWDSTTIIPPISSGYAGPAIRALMKKLNADGIEFQRLDGNRYLPIRSARLGEYVPVIDLLRSMNSARRPTPEAWRAKYERPLALLYTYSLIIALVCGTAGLPHILVRFYTNPNGVAAKRTTMWVMILIGIFYVFPPVFGVMGRNLFPELYNGIGAKGTDKIVLELPRLLNAKYAPLGSILSGITCAGAFAAFMSTFSGLLVSMTGAMAHDVYGRMLRPKSTPNERMRMFKVFAVVLGGVAMLLGSFVEPLEINFMVGQAFAIAAASYFPLLFMAVWWRKLTMKGAATGMLVGGLSAVAAISLTSFSVLALAPGPSGELFAMFKPLNTFWAGHPLLRILCEQPAIWAVPLAIGLMIVVSKLTQDEIPSDIRMKMLVLHAPEKLGLKQEYIQEHQGH